MKPEKKENVIFSYLALISLGILVVTLVLLSYLDNKNTNIIVDEEPKETPKANILTEEEVQAELDLLSNRGTSPTKMIEYGSDESENEARTDTVSSSTLDGEGSVTLINSANSVSGEASSKNSGEASSSYVPIYSVSTSEETDTVVSYSGTIFKIQEDIVVIVSNNELIKAKIDTDTKITINGKNIDSSSLKSAQNVYVEGFGNPTTKELNAKTLTVLGETKVIPL